MRIPTADEFLIIFKMLNLNERANLRLVSKEFKSIVDAIKITKLIIYEKMLALPGQLKHINEPYGLQDTAEVYDLNKFFNNPIIRGQMKSIEQLVVYGLEKGQDIGSKFEFKKLTYLELSKVIFTRSDLLKSNEIQYLILDDSYFKPMQEIYRKINQINLRNEYEANDSPSVFMYQFMNLKSKNIHYLKITHLLELKFLNYCVENDLFSSLEEIDVVLTDFDSLIYLNDQCPTLKTVHIRIGLEFGDFIDRVNQVNLGELKSKLRKDLSVFLYGVPFNQTNAEAVIDFLKQFSLTMRVNESKMEYAIMRPTYDCIKRFERDHDLTKFYAMIYLLHFDRQIVDNEFFKKFINLKALVINLTEKAKPNVLNNYLSTFANLEHVMFMAPEIDTVYSNETLDLLPKHCKRLNYLNVECRKEIDFKFVLNLPRLKGLIIRSCFAFDESIYLQLLKRKFLIMTDVCFVRSDDLSREKLKAFKDRVSERLEGGKLEFKINIHRRKGAGELIRYVLKEKDEDDIPLEEDDEDRMFYWCKHASVTANYPYVTRLKISR